MTGNAWMYLARKSDNYNYDWKEKELVNIILRQYFGAGGCFDEPIGTKEDHKFADICVKSRSIVIELDGEKHGSGDEISTSKYDYDRHDWYKRHGFTLYVINKEDTDGYDEKKVIERLVTMGLKKCT